MNEKPGIEITSADLIKRPLETPGTPPGGFNLGDITAKGREIFNQVKQVQDLINQFRQMSGGKLDEMFPFLAKMGTMGTELKGKRTSSEPPQLNEAIQFLMVIRVLEMKYGDVTLNELLDHLKAEYGNKRLSQITRGIK